MALDNKHKAALAEKMKAHEEPDGDEAEPGAAEGDESDEDEKEPAEKKEPGEKTDKEVADFCEGALEKGFMNPKIKALMAGHDQEEKAPDWVDDDALWTRAVAAVQPRDDGAGKDNLWMCIGATYSMLGGGIKQGTVIPGAEEPSEPDEAEPGEEVDEEG